jgi:hypothetical protein
MGRCNHGCNHDRKFLRINTCFQSCRKSTKIMLGFSPCGSCFSIIFSIASGSVVRFARIEQLRQKRLRHHG